MKYIRIKRFIIATTIVGIVLLISGCQPKSSSTVHNMNQKTLTEGIEISKKDLQQKGFKIDDMRVEADDKNSLWQEFSSAPGTTTLQTPLVKKMELEKKAYWVIHFAPKKLMRGGDAWVFIDKNNGEIIGTVFGK